MAEIQNIDAITNDPKWHARCCQLMLKKPEREMFVALQGCEERRLRWLKLACGYDPSTSTNM